jgi:3-phenylpropionate/trans-cinnamate dioxygenase ferredoxin component
VRTLDRPPAAARLEVRLEKSEITGDLSPIIDICPIEQLPPGAMRLVEWEDLEIAVVNCAGEVLAIEDRCSHDDGNLVEGELDDESCSIECPRHGSVFDLRTGKPLNLPAYVPVDTFPVSMADGLIQIEVD